MSQLTIISCLQSMKKCSICSQVVYLTKGDHKVIYGTQGIELLKNESSCKNSHNYPIKLKEDTEYGTNEYILCSCKCLLLFKHNYNSNELYDERRTKRIKI